MSDKLTPRNIYQDFIDNKISNKEALKLLESLINESDKEDNRAEALEILGEVTLISERIFKVLEKCLVSDESELVRFISAKILIRKYLEVEQNTLAWAIQNEKSIYFFKMLLDLLKNIDTPQIEGIKKRTMERLSSLYNLQLNDAKFILDIDFLDYSKFKREFSNFLNKFDIRNKDKADIIKENAEVGYKGLGRVKSTRNGYITHLQLKDLEKIPKSIQFLSKLEHLEIFRCKISKIPDSKGFLSKIKHIELKNNDFESLPEWVKTIAHQDNYVSKYLIHGVIHSEAHVLSLLEILSGQAFVKIEIESSFSPSLLFYYKTNELGNIIGIHMSSELSRIGIIPEEICSLKSLEELIIVNQNIKSVPNCIIRLQRLKILNLSFNKIQEIPKSLLKLDNLEELDLSGNIINSFPNSIKNMKSLRIKKI